METSNSTAITAMVRMIMPWPKLINREVLKRLMTFRAVLVVVTLTRSRSRLQTLIAPVAYYGF